MSKITHSMTNLLNKEENNYEKCFICKLDGIDYRTNNIQQPQFHKKTNTSDNMTRNKRVTKQCPYYIGAHENKIETFLSIIVPTIYCNGTMAMGCLYQLTADRKSSVPRSGRWMTAFFY